jgi:hypothetical protein
MGIREAEPLAEKGWISDAGSSEFRQLSLPERRFRGNVWESGTQDACRKTCEFPGRAEASLIGRLMPLPEKA